MLSILKMFAGQALDLQNYNEQKNVALDKQLKTCEFRPEDFQKKKNKSRNKSFLTKE